MVISIIIFGLLFTGDIPPVESYMSLTSVYGGGTCICSPMSCSGCTAQEMSSCSSMCRCTGGCKTNSLNLFEGTFNRGRRMEMGTRSAITASQFYGLWHFDTKLNGRHQVECIAGENVTVNGKIYSTVDFNVYDTINPDTIIAENSWNLMINGTNFQLSPSRLSWCHEIYGATCPVDVWYSDNIVAGRHWNDGVVGVGSFSFLFDFTRNDELN